MDKVTTMVRWYPPFDSQCYMEFVLWALSNITLKDFIMCDWRYIWFECWKFVQLCSLDLSAQPGAVSHLAAVGHPSSGDFLWLRQSQRHLRHSQPPRRWGLCIEDSVTLTFFTGLECLTVSDLILWHSLPPTVCDPSLALTQFCVLLKTMLFCRAYETLP